MTIYKKIKYRNLLSYGNNWTEFDFLTGISRIFGENGVGKSTSVTDALYFALFGKAYRNINLGQLINSINKKEFEVVLWFSVGDDEYRIERGIKPNYFRIYKNDVIVEVTAASRSYQTQLEEDIIHTSPKIFEQKDMKSLTKSMSFLTLKLADRREIVENFLDITIFSAMNKTCKDIVDALVKEIAMLEKDYSSTSLLLDQEMANLQRLYEIKKRQDDDMSEKIRQAQEAITQITEEIKRLNGEFGKVQQYKTKKAELQQRITPIQNEIRRIQQETRHYEQQMAGIQAKLNFMQRTCADCPKAQSGDMQGEIEAARQAIATRQAEEQTYTAHLDKLNGYVQMCDTFIINEQVLKSNIANSEREIQRLKASIQQAPKTEIVLDKTRAVQLKAQKEQIASTINEKKLDGRHYAFIRKMLSDEEIKAYVIKKYLPVINKILTSYLHRLKCEFIFNFNEKFEEVVLTRHKESFSYESFSEGQKRRIDLAIMFTFMEFAKQKHEKATSNLLVFDEVGTGLDAAGEEALYEILKDIMKRESKTIVIITHSSSINSEFINHTYEVTLDQGFSKLTKKDS